MILQKLKMKNFRQFNGNQEIIFAACDDDGKENITVIFGENGRGKTGIYRAIMFCLYGEHHLSQDSHVDGKELHLVNNVELRKSGGRTPVESFVELDFSHKASEYQLKRSLLGMLDEDEVIEERGGVHLIQRTPDGNTKTVEDFAEISRIIDSILHQSVREYFLFDGEKIEKLTRAGSEQRKEISKGLRNLLNIDTLEKAKKATGLLQKKLYAQLEKKSTGDYAKILHRIKKVSDRCSQIDENLKYLDSEIETAIEEKRKIDNEFEKIKEILDLLKERKTLENKEKELEKQLNGSLSEIRTRSGKLSLVLMSKPIKNVFHYVNQRKQKGEIPSEIRKDLIERILSEGKCICGREIGHKSEAFEHILKWKNRSNEVVIEDFMLELWRLLSSVSNHFEDIISNAETKLHQYALTKNDIEAVRIRIKELNDKIGSSVRSDAAKLEKVRQTIGEKITDLEAERKKSLAEQEFLEEECQTLQIQRKEKEREEGVRNELSIKADLASETHTALSDVYNEFTDEIKKVIGKSATEYFKILIDKQGREALRQIVVDDDYSIQIFDRWGKPFLANISAGQRQIMSISFIAALAKAAAEHFEMPFFMDSPFGRLSNEHRKNLINHIPDFANQWILLATDTEFRRFEARLLKQTNLWGRFYVLKGDKEGLTRIESHNTDDAFTYLKDNEESLV